MSAPTALQEEFLQNLRLHLMDLSWRLEQDPSDDVADYVLYRLQIFGSVLRITGEPLCFANYNAICRRQ